MLKVEPPDLPYPESRPIQEVEQPLLGEVKKMVWRIEVEPVSISGDCLEARQVGDGHYEESAWSKKAATSFYGVHRAGEVLEHVAHRDYIEPPGEKPRLVQIPRPDVESVGFSCGGRGLVVVLGTANPPTSAPHHVQEEPPPASDVKDGPGGSETLDPGFSPPPGEGNESFDRTRKSLSPGGPVGSRPVEAREILGCRDRVGYSNATIWTEADVEPRGAGGNPLKEGDGQVSPAQWAWRRCGPRLFLHMPGKEGNRGFSLLG